MDAEDGQQRSASRKAASRGNAEPARTLLKAFEMEEGSVAGWRSGKQVIALWKLLESTEKEASKNQADNMDETSNMDNSQASRTEEIGKSTGAKQARKHR